MKYATLFVLLLALWLAWSGLYKPLLIGLGVVSCLLCVLIAARMLRVDSAPLTFLSVSRTLTYLPWLAKEIAVSNWQVIRIVLAPKPRLHPTMLTVRGTQRTELGRVVYGNSITLTPGTLTVDIDGDALTVHALTREGAEALLEGGMDRRVAALEPAGAGASEEAAP